MQYRILLALLLAVISGCKRNGREQTVDPPSGHERSSASFQDGASGSRDSRIGRVFADPNLKTENPVVRDALEESRRIVVKRASGESLSGADLKRLRTLASQCSSSEEFWKVFGSIEPSQLKTLSDVLCEALRRIELYPGSSEPPVLRLAYSIAESTGDPEVARLAFEQLRKAPTYKFPSTPAPEGWPVLDHSGTERIQHGVQGVLASTVVRLADKSTKASYFAYLEAAPVDDKRTLLWALGNSSEGEDFQWLLKQLKGTKDPNLVDTIQRALNRIPRNMNQRAATIKESDPSKSAAIHDEAESFFGVLADRKLRVEHSFYDYY